jgi:hypothetical protein
MQRLSSPRLVTDSMGSGGEPHTSYGMSAPGTDGVAPMPQPFEVPDLADVPGQSGSTIPVGESTVSESGAWGRTGSSGHGWDQV